MKLSRIAGLLAPIAALVACSSAPVDAPEATAKSEAALQFCPGWASCQVDGPASTPADLVAQGCMESSTLMGYQSESFVPFGDPVGLPELGWFVQCPWSAESASLTPSCSYCLPEAADGYFWYEWLETEYRPCPSGCLKGPPVGEL
jgi:hypothetical protein